MGMTEIFSDNANLGDLLDSNENLKVSDVVHKAFLEIDETGTEAAAATGVYRFSVVKLKVSPTTMTFTAKIFIF